MLVPLAPFLKVIRMQRRVQRHIIVNRRLRTGLLSEVHLIRAFLHTRRDLQEARPHLSSQAVGDAHLAHALLCLHNCVRYKPNEMNGTPEPSYV